MGLRAARTDPGTSQRWQASAPEVAGAGVGRVPAPLPEAAFRRDRPGHLPPKLAGVGSGRLLLELASAGQVAFFGRLTSVGQPALPRSRPGWTGPHRWRAPMGLSLVGRPRPPVIQSSSGYRQNPACRLHQWDSRSQKWAGGGCGEGLAVAYPGIIPPGDSIPPSCAQPSTRHRIFVGVVRYAGFRGPAAALIRRPAVAVFSRHYRLDQIP